MARLTRSGIGRMRTRAKVLAARVKMLEEENKALNVMVDVANASVEHHTAGTRIVGASKKEVTLGLVMLPLPNGWMADRNLGSFPVVRHGQNYIAVHLIKED